MPASPDEEGVGLGKMDRIHAANDRHSRSPRPGIRAHMRNKQVTSDLELVAEVVNTGAQAPLDRIRAATQEHRRIVAELHNAEQATMTNPLVSDMGQVIETSMRTLVQQAVEAKASRVAILPSQVQLERYPHLTADVTRIITKDLPNGEGKTLSLKREVGDVADLIVGPDGMARVDKDPVGDWSHPAVRNRLEKLAGGKDKPVPIEKLLGKDAAARVMVPGTHDFERPISFGGEGMREYYDKIYPAVLGKVLAKIDPTIKPEAITLRSSTSGKTFRHERPYGGHGSLSGEDEPPMLSVSFRITPAVRDKLHQEGLEMLAALPEMGPGKRHDQLFDFSKDGTAHESGTEVSYFRSADPNEMYVGVVWTEPEMRRQGRSKALMQKLVEHADAEGVRLRLMAGDESGIGHDTIRNFYKSLGFREVDEVVPGRDGAPAAVEMVREPKGGVRDGAGAPVATGVPPLETLGKLYVGDKPIGDWTPTQRSQVEAYADRLRARDVLGEGQELRAYHGTSEEGGFDRFKRKRNDIGVHFGTAEQANDRLSYMAEPGRGRSMEGAHVIPVALDIKNPLRLSDLGNWDAENLAWGLKKRIGMDDALAARMTGQEVDDAMRSSRSPLAQLTALRDLIHRKGYDGIVYKNTGETAGAEPFRVERDRLYQELKDQGVGTHTKTMTSFSPAEREHPAYKAWVAADHAYRDFREKNAEDSYIATKPGTVKSATTGAIMYAAGPDAPGRGVAKENAHGLEPDLRVRAPRDSELAEKPLFTQATTNANAARQIEHLDTVAQRFPDAGETSHEWSRMQAYALASKDVPAPPYGFIRDMMGNGAVNKIKSLTPGQIADADHGFEAGTHFYMLYTSGVMTPEHTGQLFMWSFLSRGVSPYAQESLFLDAANQGIRPWIAKAARGEFTERDIPAYERWVKSVAPKGSGQPGAGAIHNLGAYGRDFLLKMGRRGEDGITHLQRVHNMLSDPRMTGQQIRREFAKFGEGVGIDNKVVSFTLLVSGRTDVMVLDRVQIKQFWDDGRFKDRNLYDGRRTPEGKTVTGSQMSTITYGVRGLMAYEAVERVLAKRVREIYEKAGRPHDASIGRYHWESWVATSGQEASHGTLDAILREALDHPRPLEGISARQGEYGTYTYGARYERAENGDPQISYSTSDGTKYDFTAKGFAQLLQEVRDPRNGVVPRGFKVTSEDFNGPWFSRPEVNRSALDALVEHYGRGSGPAVPGAAEGAVQSKAAGRPGQQRGAARPDRRPRAAEVGETSEPTAEGAHEPARYELRAQDFSDIDARGAIAKKLLAGESHDVPPAVVESAHYAIKSIIPLFPENYRVGVVNRVEPLPNGLVRATLALPDGGTLTLDGPAASILNRRAFTLPGKNVVGFVRMDLVRNFSESLRGEAYHELAHVLYVTKVLSGTSWNLLVRHARSLQHEIMDLRAVDFYRKVGRRDIAAKVDSNATMADVYRKLYAGRRDLADHLEEEAVAHMIELMHHKQISPGRTMEVMPILERVFGDDFARRLQASEPSAKFLVFGKGSRSGEHALTIEAAQRMEAVGRSDEEIASTTGWYRDDKGEWAYRIKASDLKLKPRGRAALREPERPLIRGDAKTYLDAPLLFEGYPELADLLVNIRRKSGGASASNFDAHSMDIIARRPTEVRRQIILQMQAYINEIEGHTPGEPRAMAGLRKTVAGLDREAAAIAEKRMLVESGQLEVTPAEDAAMRKQLYDLKVIRRDLDGAEWTASLKRLKKRAGRKEDERFAAGAGDDEEWERDFYQNLAETELRVNTMVERAESRRAMSHEILDEREHPLERQVRAFEAEQWKAGRTAQEIAQAIEEKFGFPITAEQVAKREVWWKLDDVSGRASNKSYSQEARAEIARLYGEGKTSKEVAEVISRLEGRTISADGMRQFRRNNLTAPAERQPAPAALGEPMRDFIHERLRARMEDPRITARSIADEVKAQFDRDVNPAYIRALGQRTGLNPEVPLRGTNGIHAATRDAMARLTQEHILTMTPSQMARLLAAETGKPVTPITVTSALRAMGVETLAGKTGGAAGKALGPEARRYAVQRLGASVDGEIVPAQTIAHEIQERFGEKWALTDDTFNQIDARRKAMQAGETVVPEGNIRKNNGAKGKVSAEARRYIVDRFGTDPGRVPTKMIAREVKDKFGEEWKLSDEGFKQMDEQRREAQKRTLRFEEDDDSSRAAAMPDLQDEADSVAGIKQAGEVVSACKA